MPYALQSMLRIRAMREDRASAELSAARQEVRKANEALEEQKRVLKEYEETKEERRDRIFESVIGRSVSREDLDRALEGVSRIDEEGVLKADNVTMAASVLKKKEEEASQARAVFVKATKERMKISEHKAMWVEAELKEEEHRLEVELEDFTGKKNTENSNDDWN